ncbi:MAG: DUF2474 domain-containing protein [Ramlibacter sp.]
MKPPLWRWPAITPGGPDERRATLRSRLLWMVGIWTASVAALFVVAIVLRWVLKS